jgi:menaquinone-dependent protoporphyrinogen oxidase
MAMTVLVAYSSKRGSTAEIAETIAATLRREGLGVCLVPAEQVESLEPSDAVVLGSAVYMKRWRVKRWRGDAKHFLKKHRKALKQMPFWVFSSGQVGDPAKDDPEWMEPPKLVEKVEEMGAGTTPSSGLPAGGAARDVREGDGRSNPKGFPRSTRLGPDSHLGPPDRHRSSRRPRLAHFARLSRAPQPRFVDFP